jgi:hypothetical protein
MPQVRNSFGADRNCDYFFTMPLLTMTSGEGKKFWRRFDAISPKRRAAEFQVAPAAAMSMEARRQE